MKKQKKKKKYKILSLHVYGILDKRLEKITKVSLDKEELRLELDLDNHDSRLSLCDFDIRVKFLL